MKQLTCEMCGSTDLIKQDGVFICQSCGCKYSVEEAKKMMIEGTVDVSGSTVKVDNSGLISSYLQMAENALDAGNNAEAENYSNKIIEIDSKAYRAWFIKGKAAGWQTTGRNNRYPESIVNWINAYQFAPEDKKEELATEIIHETANIGNAVLQMEVNSFASYRTEDNAKDVTNALSMIKKQLGELKSKTGIDVYTNDFKTILARTINAGAVSASSATDKEFGTEPQHQDTFQWNQYTDAQDRCLKLLCEAYSLSYDDDLSYTICKNYIIIAETVRDSCSYKYQASAYGNGTYIQDYSFTDTAKKVRTKTINEWKEKQEIHDPAARQESFDSTVEKCESSIVELEEALALSNYWTQHAGEKASYENEKKALVEQIAHLETCKKSIPLYETKKEIEENINALNSQIMSLGFFKKKEKIALQEKIAAAQVELETTTDHIREAEEKYDTQIKPLENRISEIDSVLTMARGRTPITHGTPPQLFVTGKKELTMTPAELLKYLKITIPKPYSLKTATEDEIINTSELEHEVRSVISAWENLFSSLQGSIDKNFDSNNVKTEEWVDDPDQAKTYGIHFCKGDTEINTILFCNAKSTGSAIEKDLCFKLQSGFTPDDAKDFIIVLSSAIFDMLPSTDMAGLQKAIAAGIYGMTAAKGFKSDGLKIEFERGSNVTVTISQE